MSRSVSLARMTSDSCNSNGSFVSNRKLTRLSRRKPQPWQATKIRERYEHQLAACTCEEDQNYRPAVRQSSLDYAPNTQSPRPLKEAFSSDSHVHTRTRFHRPFRPARRIPITAQETARLVANPRYSHRKKSLSTPSFVNGALNTC
jgi:hypothetical protein